MLPLKSIPYEIITSVEASDGSGGCDRFQSGAPSSYCDINLRFRSCYSIGYRRTIVKGTIINSSYIAMTCHAVVPGRCGRETSYRLDGGRAIYDTIFVGTIIDSTYSFEKPGLVVCHGLA